MLTGPNSLVGVMASILQVVSLFPQINRGNKKASANNKTLESCCPSSCSQRLIMNLSCKCSIGICHQTVVNKRLYLRAAIAGKVAIPAENEKADNTSHVPKTTDLHIIDGRTDLVDSRKTEPDSKENDIEPNVEEKSRSMESNDESSKDMSQANDGNVSDEDIELEKGYKMSRVCEKLIEVFLVEKPDPDDWRKLLAFSEEWSKLRPYFFRTCKARAEAEEDLKKKGDLFKLTRRLKEVDEDMMRHNELLAEVEKDELQLDAVVARRRDDFTGDFFKHLAILCDASYRNLDRREELAELAAKCLAAVEAHDKVAADTETLDRAKVKFADILNSPSLEAACKKIDLLAKRQELDSTFMLLVTKAWAAAQEAPMMKEEVKDIMYHLYKVTRGNMQRLVPKEVRILKYLLTIEDPQERFAAMTEAFSPGDEIEGKDVDTLYTTPNRLHKWINHVLEAYYASKEGTLIKEAQKLMNPIVISRVEVLKKVLEDQFM